MARVQNYGITYPFTNDNTDEVYLDLNKSYEDAIKSQVLHIIFTPKGQRIRDTKFGTDLIKYIFDPSDGTTYEQLKASIFEAISSRVPSVKFRDISIYDDEEDEHSKIINVEYSVRKGMEETINNVALKI